MPVAAIPTPVMARKAPTRRTVPETVDARKVPRGSRDGAVQANHTTTGAVHTSNGWTAIDRDQHAIPIQSSPALRVSLQNSRTSTDRANSGAEPIRESGMTACNHVC